MNWTATADYLAANWMEDAGVLTTLVGIWLTTRRKLICWPVVLISDVLYMIVFYRVHLYSDALLQIFFLTFTLYGWWYWWRGVRDEGEVRIVCLPTRSLLTGLAAGAVGGGALGFLMKKIYGTALPFLDAMLAGFSLVASWWGGGQHF